MNRDLFDITPILGTLIAAILWAFRWYRLRRRDAKAKRPVSFEIGILGQSQELKPRSRTAREKEGGW